MPETKLIETGASTQSYYESLNRTYRKVFKKLLMLHYPFFKEHGETLEDRQVNLTRHCISRLESLEDKHVLEVGCGNGTQSIFVYENYNPAKLTGVDINEHNISLANSINGSHQHLEFMVDDAQQLKTIPDDSVDVLLCIESAFHYPDKPRFLQEIRRVLKPHGTFLIADILSHSNKNRFFMEKWKRKMNFHHWTKEQYKEAFENHGLHIEHKENITEPVREGYKDYSNWVSRDQFKSFFEYLHFKLFVFIQVKLNVILLKNRRQYFIFVGKAK